SIFVAREGIATQRLGHLQREASWRLAIPQKLSRNYHIRTTCVTSTRRHVNSVFSGFCSYTWRAGGVLASGAVRQPLALISAPIRRCFSWRAAPRSLLARGRLRPAPRRYARQAPATDSAIVPACRRASPGT